MIYILYCRADKSSIISRNKRGRNLFFDILGYKGLFKLPGANPEGGGALGAQAPPPPPPPSPHTHGLDTKRPEYLKSKILDPLGGLQRPPDLQLIFSAADAAFELPTWQTQLCIRPWLYTELQFIVVKRNGVVIKVYEIQILYFITLLIEFN